MGYVKFSPCRSRLDGSAPERQLHWGQPPRNSGVLLVEPATSRARLRFVLRAALIGFPSSGKSTLFQLMTSAKEAPRGKGDVSIGISKVPDTRLDTLTAMYNPRKRVPATVEFTDLIAPSRTGAQALVDVAAYKNADALVHVVRAFRDEAVPHPSGSVDPARDAQAMEDELILADLGVAERRLERLARDLKKK